MDNYSFSMDWLNGTVQYYDIISLFDHLEVFSSKLKRSRWVLQKNGKYNYRFRYCLDDSTDIQFMYNVEEDTNQYIASVSSNNPGIFWSISGDGIRYLRSLGGDQSALNKLLFFFFEHDFKASRFDVACDIFDKRNSVVPLLDKAFRYFLFPRVGKPTLCTSVHRVRSNYQSWRYYDDNGKIFYNHRLGSHGSRFGMFRCYNKLYQMKDCHADIKSFLGFEPSYWYRLEYELHKENADLIFSSAMKRSVDDNCPLSFDSCFFTAFDRIFRVVDFNSPGYSLANCDSSKSWSDFHDMLANCCKLFILSNSVKPSLPLSKSRLSSFLKKNERFVYAMLCCLADDNNLLGGILIDGRDKFFDSAKYNPLRDELNIDCEAYNFQLHFAS